MAHPSLSCWGILYLLAVWAHAHKNKCGFTIPGHRLAAQQLLQLLLNIVLAGQRFLFKINWDEDGPPRWPRPYPVGECHVIEVAIQGNVVMQAWRTDGSYEANDAYHSFMSESEHQSFYELFSWAMTSQTCKQGVQNADVVAGGHPFAAHCCTALCRDHPAPEVQGFFD